MATSALTQWLVSLGLTRDSLLWFWGRLVSGAVLIFSGLVPLDGYLSPNSQRVLRVMAAVVLWFSGKWDTSPLPSKAEVASGMTKAPEMVAPSTVVVETTKPEKPIEVIQLPKPKE
jgi:hypothetical protein